MRNIPLNVLDEYAKLLTPKQVNKLYESKCNKKYKKPLYENKQYQSKDNYSVYLTNYILEKANSSITKVLTSYVNKFKLQYNIINEGVKLYTSNPLNYKELIEKLIDDKFNINLVKRVANKDYRKLIESINYDKDKKKKIIRG